MVELIVASIQTLIEHSALGRPGRIVGTRELIVTVTNYLVAYRVSDAHIDILTILHGAQQWPDHLKESP